MKLSGIRAAASIVICGVQSLGAASAAAAGLLRAQLGHGLLEHVVVELEADLADLPGLLVAEEVAGTADVEVVAGQLEAGAQPFQRLDHAAAGARRCRPASCSPGR